MVRRVELTQDEELVLHVLCDKNLGWSLKTHPPGINKNVKYILKSIFCQRVAKLENV